jgi:hypothetical protein
VNIFRWRAGQESIKKKGILLPVRKLTRKNVGNRHNLTALQRGSILEKMSG